MIDKMLMCGQAFAIRYHPPSSNINILSHYILFFSYKFVYNCKIRKIPLYFFNVMTFSFALCLFVFSTVHQLLQNYIVLSSLLGTKYCNSIAS